MDIVELTQIGLACPSQWEGRLADGQPIYIRYRWGTLTVSVGSNRQSLYRAIGEHIWFEEQVGASLDSAIELDDVYRITGLRPPA